MRVSADLQNGYKFNIDSDDFNYLPLGFKSLLTPDSGGVIFKSQAAISDLLVIGKPFCNVAGVLVQAVKTYTPKTKFTALSDHKVTTSAEFGSIISIIDATRPRSYQWIKSTGKLFYANHIPQLYQSFNGSIISGVDGVFDWKGQSFSGAIYFGVKNASS